MSSRWLLALLLAGCQAAPNVAGTWTGTMASSKHVGVRFILEDQNGQLHGRTFFEDTQTHQFSEMGGLMGAYVSGTASWTTDGDVVIAGKFVGDTFTGTLEFPAEGDVPARKTALTLSR